MRAREKLFELKVPLSLCVLLSYSLVQTMEESELSFLVLVLEVHVASLDIEPDLAEG